MKTLLNKEKLLKLSYTLLIYSVIINISAYSSPSICDAELTHKPAKKIETKSKIIYVKSTSIEKIFLVVSNSPHFDTIDTESPQKIYTVNQELNKFRTKANEKYFHFIFSEASKTNAELEGLKSNLFTLESDNMGLYHVSSGKILPHDIISIPINEALQQVNARKTVLINYTNKDKTKIVKYLLNFKKLYSEIKSNTEIQVQENLPKINEEVLDINSDKGKIEFQKFQQALSVIKETINDPNKTEMIIKNIEPPKNEENVTDIINKKND